MSWCRRSEACDLYVYADAYTDRGDYFVCSSCPIVPHGGDLVTKSAEQMAAHILGHAEAGDRLPEWYDPATVVAQLKAEAH